MNLYGLTLLFLFGLLMFIFYLKSSLRRKVNQRSWIERIESLAKDNHLIWSAKLPYFQNQRLNSELVDLEQKQREENLVLNISNQEDKIPKSELLKYPLVKKLFRRLMPQIESYAQMMGLDSKYLTITAWAELNPKESHKQYSHDKALFSGCYHLKDDNESNFEKGKISFFHKENNENLTAAFNPEPGDLILFPSDMCYSFSPSVGQDQRISIVFNVYFGNRKKSWMVPKSLEMDPLKKVDPFYELSGQKNAPHSANLDSRESSMLFHTSKIKKKFMK